MIITICCGEDSVAYHPCLSGALLALKEHGVPRVTTAALDVCMWELNIPRKMRQHMLLHKKIFATSKQVYDL
jgi:hypothetical protein